MSEKPFTGTVGQMKTASKFLASEDFIGLGEVELTISGVYENDNETMQDGKKKDFFSIGFNGKPKRMVLNATNRKTLAAAFGANVSNWIGKKCKVFVKDGIRNPAGGETVCGLRLIARPDPTLLKAKREQMTKPKDPLDVADREELEEILSETTFANLAEKPDLFKEDRP